MSAKCRILKKGYCEITQYYGGDNGHLGIDIVGQGYSLDTVLAHSSGKVIYIQTGYSNNQGSTGNASYGNMVKIDHGNGWVTLYAHLNNVYVTNGQQITKGQEIGYMGNTGNSYGAHTHFEISKNNTRINPLEYLDKDLFSTITPTVERNESINQLKVNVDDLRVRSGAGTNQSIIGIAKLNGIYNYYEVKENDGYTWYRIAEEQWLANKSNWCTIYPKKEGEDEMMVSELNNIIKQQEIKLTELQASIQDYQEKIETLEEENLTLKDESQYKTFVAPKEDNYFIKLKENEKLIYRKVF